MAHPLIPGIKSLYRSPPNWAVKLIWGGITGLIFLTMLIPLEIAAIWQGARFSRVPAATLGTGAQLPHR